MLFSKEIGLDLGTSSILVYVEDKGIVVNEPSIVAYDAANDKIIFLSYFDIFIISHITNLSLSYIITKHSVQYSTITKTLLFYNSFFILHLLLYIIIIVLSILFSLFLKKF